MDSELSTNRDAYLAAGYLAELQGKNERTLEVYLRALLAISRSGHKTETIGLTDLFGWLTNAFHSEPAEYEKHWSRHRDYRHDARTGFHNWESVLISQVVDLSEMAAAGTLQNDMRYFGVDAPSGQRWYNFDPCTYIECAVAGTFGGWQPDDSTGREFVPWPVAALDKGGNLLTCEPQDLQDPVVPIGKLNWKQCAEFLRMGQWYE